MQLDMAPPDSLPAYHDDLLTVTVTGDQDFQNNVVMAGVAALRGSGFTEQLLASLLPEGSDAVRSLGTAFAHAVPVMRNRAIDVLERFSEAGDIVDIRPLVPHTSRLVSAVGTGPQAITVALASSLSGTREGGGERAPLGATNLLYVRNAAVREKISKALSDKPGITAHLVPRRYLCAKARGPKGVAAAIPHSPDAAAWHLAKTRTRAARDKAGFVEPSGIRVGVLDTGIDNQHPRVRDRLARYIHSYPDLRVVSGDKDIVGHGTHVAGTIAASLDGESGVTGMCQCDLWALKIFSDQPEFIPQFGYYMYTVQPQMYLRALLTCLEENIRVLNLSIAGTAPTDPEEAKLLNALTANKCVVIAAIGNWRALGSPISYPAAHPGVIAVGATDQVDRVTSFSNGGPHITISAPGRSIWSTMPTYSGQKGFWADLSGGQRKEGKPIKRETEYGEDDGTSMACPQVTAAAAMYIAKHPDASPVEVRTALSNSADKVPDMKNRTFHEDYGSGRLNVEALLG